MDISRRMRNAVIVLATFGIGFGFGFGVSSLGSHWIVVPTQSLSTIVPDVSPRTSNTVLGVVLGFVASTAVQLLMSKKSQRDQATKLRKALISELYSMDDFFRYMYDGVDYSHSAASETAELVSTEIFESHAQNIGSLTKEEVNALVIYYSQLDNIRTLIRIASKTSPEEVESDTVSGPGEEYLMRLNNLWHICISRIEQNIDQDDLQKRPDLIFVAEKIKEDAQDDLESSLDDLRESLEDDPNINADEAMADLENMIDNPQLIENSES